MEQEGFKRKLTAILSADVEGYSRLMGEDEDATIRTLTTYRDLMSTLIQKHRGRVVDSPGDNLLAEFGSVVDAVRCAVEVQEELRIRNAELPENRRMHFRIGVNLGDVVEEEGRIYGDGVNITARVEGLAEGGGICISGTVYDSIKSKLSLSYEPMGEHTVKNITEPVRVYRMRVGPDAAALGVSKEKKLLAKRWQWAALSAMVFLILGALAVWNFYFRLPSIEPASVEKMAYSLPEKPSIAVLAFDNLSGEPNQDYFADGIAEDIITQLSQIHNLFVIARNSSFSYKGKKVKVQQVAEDLGVRYVLDGSVQKSGHQVRISAQLVDAMTGKHLWADRYDRELKDVFAVQDDISRKVVTELAVKLTEGEFERVMQQGTQNRKAWTHYRNAVEQFRRFKKSANVKSRELSEQAIGLDANYSQAYSLLSWTYAFPVRMGWSSSPAEDLKKAEELANKASGLDSSNPDVQNVLGFIYMLRGQYDKAIIQGKRAVELAPNVAETYALLALSQNFAGHHNDAIDSTLKAMRLAPFYPPWYVALIGRSYFMAERFEEALESFNRYLEKKPDARGSPVWVAATYSAMGQPEKARAEAEIILKKRPTFSLEAFRKAYPYKNKADWDRLLAFAREAGLPE